MPKIQLISAFVNLAGDRNNTVFRGPDDPVTFPEALVLQSLHGGQEHVHSMVDVGFVERDFAEEHARLTSLYGKIVSDLFPPAAGRASLPAGDETIPTLDAVNAANAAAAEAMAASKTKKSAPKPKSAASAEPAPVPALDDLPSE